MQEDLKRKEIETLKKEIKTITKETKEKLTQILGSEIIEKIWT